MCEPPRLHPMCAGGTQKLEGGLFHATAGILERNVHAKNHPFGSSQRTETGSLPSKRTGCVHIPPKGEGPWNTGTEI
eukprot:scaffold47_cov334-Pavlova_lutheri.AAC.54